MIENTDLIILAATVVWLHMTFYYIYSMLIKDTSIVDIGWGLGFVLLSWVYWMVLDPDSGAFKLLVLVVSAWGLRLGLHIFSRHRGRGEDFRYKNWRNQWGKTHWWRSYLQVFMLQGLMMLIIGSPIIVAAINVDSFDTSILFWIGLIIWIVGYYFEAVGDWQLQKFLAKRERNQNKKNNKQIMTSGVWRYTRHPNYFGEVSMWWGIWLMVVQLEYGWLAIISPLTITFLLLKVSGIPLLEEKYAGNKEFEKYKARTSAFFPLPPKK